MIFLGEKLMRRKEIKHSGQKEKKQEMESVGRGKKNPGSEK